MKEGVSQIERQQDPVNPGIGIRDVPEKPTRDLFGINLQDEDRRPFLKSVIVMGLNLVVIVVTVVLLGKVPGLAKRTQEARTDLFRNSETVDYDVLGAEIEARNTQIAEIEGALATEQGLIDFVSSVDSLRNEGIVTRFSFLANSPVKDKNGSPGLPFVVEFNGDEGRVERALVSVQSLPYLTRPVEFGLVKKTAEDGGGAITILYNGFIYVSKDVAQN